MILRPKPPPQLTLPNASSVDTENVADGADTLALNALTPSPPDTLAPVDGPDKLTFPKLPLKPWISPER